MANLIITVDKRSFANVCRLPSTNVDELLWSAVGYCRRHSHEWALIPSTSALRHSSTHAEHITEAIRSRPLCSNFLKQLCSTLLSEVESPWSNAWQAGQLNCRGPRKGEAGITSNLWRHVSCSNFNKLSEILWLYLQLMLRRSSVWGREQSPEETHLLYTNLW